MAEGVFDGIQLPNPNTSGENGRVLSSLQSFLHSEEFGRIYGANRAFYQLYGDHEPTHFVNEYTHPTTEYLTETRSYRKAGFDEQRTILNQIRDAGELLLSKVIPFTIAKNRQAYSFSWGHESNDVTQKTDLCRGFLISVDTPFEKTLIVQMDPGRNRSLFDQDTNPSKYIFTSTLLNILLTHYSEALRMNVGERTYNGAIPLNYMAITNEEFDIESLSRVKNKPFATTIPGVARGPVNERHMPWRVAFDVIY
jgi:hypothetical protein